jgi:hypothetical protein
VIISTKQRAVLAVTMSILLLRGAACATPLERSVSPSRQFIVYGADARARGAVSDLAERTKSNLLSLLHQPDRWTTPVLINLQLPQATRPDLPPAAFRVSQTGFGLKLQLDLMLAPDVDATAIERELLRALVVEMMYRAQPNTAPGAVLVQPPEWLVEGALAAAPGRDRAPFVDALLSSNEIVPLQQFLQQRPALLDSPARTLYRAYSLAFVQLLLADDGPARLGRYVANLTHASNDPIVDLKAQFPILGNDAEKTWRVNVAQVRAAEGPRLLNFAETERQLDELLRGKPPDSGASKDFRLEDVAQKKISPPEKAALMQLRESLLELGVHANPLLRSTVQEYEQIAVLLTAGKRKRITQRLARLKETRAQLAGRMSDIDDYMNWFEATQSQTKSGAFIDYLRTATKSTEPEPRRRDPLSIYLDALEQQTQN